MAIAHANRRTRVFLKILFLSYPIKKSYVTEYIQKYAANRKPHTREMNSIRQHTTEMPEMCNVPGIIIFFQLNLKSQRTNTRFL